MPVVASATGSARRAASEGSARASWKRFELTTITAPSVAKTACPTAPCTKASSDEFSITRNPPSTPCTITASRLTIAAVLTPRAARVVNADTTVAIASRPTSVPKSRCECSTKEPVSRSQRSSG